MTFRSETVTGTGITPPAGSSTKGENGNRTGREDLALRIERHAKQLVCSFALLLPVLLAGCGGHWNQPTLTAIAVAPANPAIPKAAIKQFTATGINSDGTSTDLTTLVNWVSSNTAVASVDSRGLATGVTVGSTLITASYGGQSASTTLTVTPALLMSIAVAPSLPGIAKNLTSQFTALGIYSDGTSQDLTTVVDWNSGSSNIATMPLRGGLATGVAAGQAVISAAFGGQTGHALLTVTAATLNSIRVTPAVANIVKGLTSQFTAVGVFSDGSSQDLTALATWGSATPGVATMPLQGGLATGVGAGTSVVTATFTGVHGNANLTVAAVTLNSITIAPSSQSVNKNLSAQFTAIGTFSDGSSSDITASVTWSSLNTAVATVNPLIPGEVKGILAGTASIRATGFGQTAVDASLTVTAATLKSVSIVPTPLALIVGASHNLTAMATFSDGTSVDVTASAAWVSNGIGFATVNPSGTPTSGLVSGVAAGSTTVTATYLGTAGNATVNVSAASLVSILIAPVAPGVNKGDTKQFIALGTFDNGTSADITDTVIWTSLDTTVATLNPSSKIDSGLATGVKAGTATIHASRDGKIGSATLTVFPINLGLAARFGTFGGIAGMTNTGISTVITGSNGNTADIGTIATATSSITGFHDSAPSDIYTETGSNVGSVTGKIYTCAVSTTGPTSVGVNAASCALATQSFFAAQSAYTDLVAQPSGPDPGAGSLSGLTLAPGVYTAAGGSFQIQGSDLVLDAGGDPNAFWVFQMATTLTVGGPGAAAPQNVLLINGAQAKNVYWQVGSFATINAGGGGTMVGTIVSQAGASFSTAGSVIPVTLNGRAISLGGSVTMVNTFINVPAP